MRKSGGMSALPIGPFPPSPASTADPEVIRANDWAAYRELDALQSHWEVKNWAPGRRGYYWYLTFDDPDLTALALKCQERLGSDGIDPIPTTGLHLTLFGLGAKDSVTDAEVGALAVTARRRLTDFEAFDVTIGPATGSRSAIRLSVTPWDPVLALHHALRESAAEVLPDLRIRETSSLRPHLGLGYINREQPAAPVIDKVAALRSLPPVTVPVRQAHLVEVWRDGHEYRWQDVEVIELGR